MWFYDIWLLWLCGPWISKVSRDLGGLGSINNDICTANLHRFFLKWKYKKMIYIPIQFTIEQISIKILVWNICLRLNTIYCIFFTPKKGLELKKYPPNNGYLGCIKISCISLMKEIIYLFLICSDLLHRFCWPHPLEYYKNYYYGAWLHTPDHSITKISGNHNNFALGDSDLSLRTIICR